MKKIGVGHADVTELEKKYVNDCLDSQRLSPGKYVEQFESLFAKAHGNKFAMMCSSGTAAIHLALECLKETEGWTDGEVIVPAITFIATSNACIHAGLKPVFVDIDETYNIDPAKIEKAITQKTRAIIPVHLFGLPCDMDKIMKIAKKHNLKVIEDCAEAHFAVYNGQPVGSFGDLSCFSTYVAHTITTGIGGLVLTNDSKKAEIIRSLIAHGRACSCIKCVAADPTKVCPIRFDKGEDKRFTFLRIGYSYRVGEIEGALGLAQFERRGDIMSKRSKNAAYLTQNLKDLPQLKLPQVPPGRSHSFMMYPILVENKAELVKFLEKNNIETRPFLPLLSQPIYKKLFGDIEDYYPMAKKARKKGLYIGCHHGLTKDDLDYIIAKMHEFYTPYMKSTRLSI